MPRHPSNTPKTGIVHEKRPNGDRYVYERITIYRPELGYAEVLKRTLLGKIPAGETEMVPTRTRKKPAVKSASDSAGEEVKADDAQTKEDTSAMGADSPDDHSGENPVTETDSPSTDHAGSLDSIGMLDIFHTLGEQSGIAGELYQAVQDRDTTDQILSVVYYWIATEGNLLSLIETWQLNHQMPYSEGIREEDCRNLFQAIGIQEGIQIQFFRQRFRTLGGRQCLAFATTLDLLDASKSSTAGFGENRSKCSSPVKVLVLYDANNLQPLAFSMEEEHTPEHEAIVSSFQELCGFSGGTVQKAEVILDTDSGSEETMAYLMDSGLDFILPQSLQVAWIHDLLVKHEVQMKVSPIPWPADPDISALTIPVTKTFACRKKDIDDDGASVPFEEEITRTVHVHLYYDLSEYMEERRALHDELREIIGILSADRNMLGLSNDQKNRALTCLQVEKDGSGLIVSADIDPDRFAEATRCFGFHALVSTAEADPFEALRKWQKRGEVRRDFQRMDLHTVIHEGNIQRDPTVRGRIFTGFVHLCYQEYYKAALRKIEAIIRTKTSESHSVSSTKKTKAGITERDLLDWIQNKSLSYQMQWFDFCTDRDNRNAIVQNRLSADILKRDRLYLQLLLQKNP